MRNLRAVVLSLLCPLSAVLVSTARAEPFAYVITDEPGYGSLWVIDTASNAVKGSPVSVGVGPFAIALAGNRVYVGNQNGDEVAVIDTGSRKVISRLQGPPGHRPLALAASPDGKRIYLTQDSYQAPGPDGLLSVIDTDSNQFIGSPMPLYVAPFGIATSPDGKRAYVTAGSEGIAVSVVDLAKRAVIATIPAAMKQPSGIALTPDGMRAVVTDEAGNSVWVIDTVANAVVGEPIVVAPSPEGVAVAPDGRRAYVVSYAGDCVTVIDVLAQKAVATESVRGGPTHIALTADGTYAYVGTSQGTVSVLETGSLVLIGSPIRVGRGVRGIALSR